MLQCFPEYESFCNVGLEWKNNVGSRKGREKQRGMQYVAREKHSELGLKRKLECGMMEQQLSQMKWEAALGVWTSIL